MVWKFTDRNSAMEEISERKSGTMDFLSRTLRNLTRVKNKLISFLPNATEVHYDMVLEYVKSFDDRFEIYTETCEEQISRIDLEQEELQVFFNWYLEKRFKNKQFREDVQLWLDKYIPKCGASENIVVEDRLTSVSQRCLIGRKTSSARIRLLEDKAKSASERALRTKKLELEEWSIKLKRQYEDEKRRLINEIKEIKLQEDELNRTDHLEKGSSISSTKSTSFENDRSLLQSIKCIQSKSNSFNRMDQPSEISQGNLLELLSTWNEFSVGFIINRERGRLPHLEPGKFYGANASECNRFSCSFSGKIENRGSNNDDHCEYFGKLTVVSPSDLVQICHGGDPEASYSETVDLLKQRYGSEFKIGHLWIQEFCSNLMKTADTESIALQCSIGNNRFGRGFDIASFNSSYHEIKSNPTGYSAKGLKALNDLDLTCDELPLYSAFEVYWKRGLCIFLIYSYDPGIALVIVPA